jgi:hypothetical protein
MSRAGSRKRYRQNRRHADWHTSTGRQSGPAQCPVGGGAIRNLDRLLGFARFGKAACDRDGLKARTQALLAELNTKRRTPTASGLRNGQSDRGEDCCRSCDDADVRVLGFNKSLTAQIEGAPEHLPTLQLTTRKAAAEESTTLVQTVRANLVVLGNGVQPIALLPCPTVADAAPFTAHE